MPSKVLSACWSGIQYPTVPGSRFLLRLGIPGSSAQYITWPSLTCSRNLPLQHLRITYGSWLYSSCFLRKTFRSHFTVMLMLAPAYFPVAHQSVFRPLFTPRTSGYLSRIKIKIRRRRSGAQGVNFTFLITQ